jgi:hypothetical protein
MVNIGRKNHFPLHVICQKSLTPTSSMKGTRSMSINRSLRFPMILVGTLGSVGVLSWPAVREARQAAQRVLMLRDCGASLRQVLTGQRLAASLSEHDNPAISGRFTFVKHGKTAVFCKYLATIAGLWLGSHENWVTEGLASVSARSYAANARAGWLSTGIQGKKRGAGRSGSAILRRCRSPATP